MLPFPCSSYRKSIPRAIDTSTLFLAILYTYHPQLYSKYERCQPAIKQWYCFTPVYGSQHRPGLRSSSAESHVSDGSLPKTRTGSHLQFRSVGHLGSLGRVCLRDVHSISPCRHLSTLDLFEFAHRLGTFDAWFCFSVFHVRVLREPINVISRTLN